MQKENKNRKDRTDRGTGATPNYMHMPAFREGLPFPLSPCPPLPNYFLYIYYSTKTPPTLPYFVSLIQNMKVKPYSGASNKRYTATFADGKIVHFGLAGGSTYIDHKNKSKRAAYIARHKVNEDHNNPKTAGSLARHLLWGDHTSLRANITSFKRRFGL